MPDEIDAVADKLEGVIDGTDNEGLRRLLRENSTTSLSQVIDRCRSRNLRRLNEATGTAAGAIPLDVSAFQRREYELALIRRLFG
jgi:hypothetical protein